MIGARTRPSLRTLVATLCVATLLGSCSSSDQDPAGDDPPTTTTTTAPPTEAMIQIGEDAQLDLGLTEDLGLCLGRTLVELVGEDEALALNESDATLAELSEDQVDAVRTAFNDCVPGRALAEDVTRQFYASIGTATEPDQEVFDCVADSLDGRTGDVALEGLAASAQESDLTVTTEALDGCVPITIIEELFVRSFEGSDLSPAQAVCAANQIAREISLEQLVEVAGAGAELPADVQESAQDAVANCL